MTSHTWATSQRNPEALELKGRKDFISPVLGVLESSWGKDGQAMAAPSPPFWEPAEHVSGGRLPGTSLFWKHLPSLADCGGSAGLQTWTCAWGVRRAQALEMGHGLQEVLTWKWDIVFHRSRGGRRDSGGGSLRVPTEPPLRERPESVSVPIVQFLGFIAARDPSSPLGSAGAEGQDGYTPTSPEFSTHSSLFT